jgi:phenylalanine-4-hydroxylase
MSLPKHLLKYVVEQDYDRYTPVDQAVWRYIMKQLRSFLAEHAHPCYLDGLQKTGIETDRIPEISVMSAKLEKFGWRAVPVSGFIPPAAFMELQSLGYLPIASDMRTMDHLLYTPAPDIVHEAAGHAPILVDPEFASYLKAYANVARKAILSRQDLEQYEAIRVLSDLKEDPSSTPEDITSAETRLKEVTAAMSHISEAALLARMNWWTAEYGLIGTLENPKIFGAGLLSSVGEAAQCLKSSVRKLPLTLDCINYAYDITEQQPQLFVTPNFSTLTEVLEELADTMAFRVGGKPALDKAIQAGSVNTVELNSGLQISGVLTTARPVGDDVAYLQFQGPSQLCLAGQELIGHSRKMHAEGFGSPVGFLKGQTRCLSEFHETDLLALGVDMNQVLQLHFASGVRVEGRVSSYLRGPDGALIVISFKDCKVSLGSEVLFQPEWGSYDMAVGSKITSVFGGPADRESYGELDDFVAKKIPRKTLSPIQEMRNDLYREIRSLRNSLGSAPVAKADLQRLRTLAEEKFASDWLLRLELYELAQKGSGDIAQEILLELRALADQNEILREPITDGLRLVHPA